MRRSNPTIVITGILAVFAGLAGALLLKGGLYISLHDGDMLHLFEIVFRIADGERPHKDFVTPIGVLAVWPIAAFVQAGYGIGMAFILAQISVGGLLVAAAIWIGLSRLSTAWAVFFGGALAALSVAIIHGTTQAEMSVSMHYNRWAWGLAFTAIAIAFLPPVHRKNLPLDAVILGLAMVALGMMKVTYVVAFTPAIVAMLVLRGATRTLVAALGVAVVAMIGVTLVIGIDGWQAYIDDLLSVALSPFRDYPTAPLGQVISAPAYLPATCVGFAAFILLRLAGRQAVSLGLLLLIPAFIFVTYQNYGNDPQWLLMLAIIVAAWLPERGTVVLGSLDARQATTITLTAALVLALPSLTNIALSPLRNFAQDPEVHVKVFPRAPQHDDLFVYVEQANRFDNVVAGDGPGSGMEQFAEDASRSGDDLVVNGEALPFCLVKTGIQAWMRTIAADLEQAGYANGTKVLAADLLQGIFLFSDGLEAVPGSAPWIYGGTPGLENADYLLIPTCPIDPRVRAHYVDLIAEQGLSLNEVYRSPLFILMEVSGWDSRPAPSALQLSAASSK